MKEEVMGMAKENGENFASPWNLAERKAGDFLAIASELQERPCDVSSFKMKKIHHRTYARSFPSLSP